MWLLLQREPAVPEGGGAERAGRPGSGLAQHEEGAPPAGERAAARLCAQQAQPRRPIGGRRPAGGHRGRGELMGGT